MDSKVHDAELLTITSIAKRTGDDKQVVRMALEQAGVKPQCKIGTAHIWGIDQLPAALAAIAARKSRRRRDPLRLAVDFRHSHHTLAGRPYWVDPITNHANPVYDEAGEQVLNLLDMGRVLVDADDTPILRRSDIPGEQMMVQVDGPYPKGGSSPSGYRLATVEELLATDDPARLETFRVELEVVRREAAIIDEETDSCLSGDPNV